MKELILGGVRSGKSRLAERRALGSGLSIVYIATATPGDEEMRRRIEEHRKRRPAGWLTIEEPRALAQAVRKHAGKNRCVLIECLTLWLTNLLCAAPRPQELEVERAALLTVVREMTGHLIIVSNETGLGIVPTDALSRRFSEEAGLLHQDLAQICDRVTFVAAGFPLLLKGAAG
jgi:adenosylcobinamide kinase / adenosylcobinamide-phosphate guanylyltransferase